MHREARTAITSSRDADSIIAETASMLIKSAFGRASPVCDKFASSAPADRQSGHAGAASGGQSTPWRERYVLPLDLGASFISPRSLCAVWVSADDRALGAALSYAVDVRNRVVVAAGNVGAAQCPLGSRAMRDSATVA